MTASYGHSTKRTVAKREITADEQYVELLDVQAGERVSVSVVATALIATVAVQRRLPGETAFQTAKDIYGNNMSYTAAVETSYEADEDCDLRIGSTAFVSATALFVRLGKGKA